MTDATDLPTDRTLPLSIAEEILLAAQQSEQRLQFVMRELDAMHGRPVWTAKLPANWREVVEAQGFPALAQLHRPEPPA